MCEFIYYLLYFSEVSVVIILILRWGREGIKGFGNLLGYIISNVRVGI